MANNHFRTHTRLSWHICAFCDANSPSTAHKLAFHDKHPPTRTNIFTFNGTKICTVNNCHLRHIPYDVAHTRQLGHKYAFHGTCSPSTAHNRLMRHILAFRGNICLSWHTFSLKRHKQNKSTTALIIAKHDSIVAYTTPYNGRKSKYLILALTYMLPNNGTVPINAENNKSPDNVIFICCPDNGTYPRYSP